MTRVRRAKMEGLCGNKCSKCTLNKQCGGCSCCEAAACSNNCKRCYVLCAKRAESIPYLNSIGGPTISLNANIVVDLPGHIPVLPDRMKEMPNYDLMPVIGIHGGNMLSRNGEKINASYLNKGFADALNLDPRTEGILQFYVKDRTLEGFWDNRKDIYRDLHKLNFKAIISPNFSVYEDAPRVDHLFNIKRTTISYNELLEAGLNAIPDISWYSKNDLDQWIREINNNKLKMVAFSFQVVDVELKASNIWKEYLLGFRYLCQNIHPGVKLIIIGLTSPRRITEVFKAAEGRYISILNQSAFIQSRRGMLSENRVPNSELTKEELFDRNIIYFNNLYSSLNKRFNQEDEGNCQRQGVQIL